MKKPFVVALCLLLCLSLFGCGTSAPAAPAETAPPALHTLVPDPSLDTLDDEDGADAFANSLDHPDSAYFVIRDYYNLASGGSLHILPKFATYQQTTEYSCGCASALMVLRYYGVADYNELEICDLVEIDERKGTSVEGLAAFFEGAGFNVDVHADTEPRFEAIEDAEAFLLAAIDGGTPVMVDWEDWGGHWQTVIGLDTVGTADPYDDVLIMADSYDITDHYQDGYYIVPFGRFFSMWREGACAQKDVPYAQPFVVAVRPG